MTVPQQGERNFAPEALAKIVADTPDRFVGLGSVPLQNAELALVQISTARRPRFFTACSRGDEDPLGMVAQVKRLPRAERDLIVGGNAAKLLKLKLK